MHIWDYIEKENEVKYLIEQLTPLIERSNCNATIAPFDDIDLELFLEEYAVAVGLDEIKNIVRKEWERRKSLYDCVTDESAREFAIDNLKDRFFDDCPSLFKGSSVYATAIDWLGEQYTLLSIPLDEFDGSNRIFICFDFTEVKFDVQSFIDNDWYWYCQDIYDMIKDMMKKMKDNC